MIIIFNHILPDIIYNQDFLYELEFFNIKDGIFQVILRNAFCII